MKEKLNRFGKFLKRRKLLAIILILVILFPAFISAFSTLDLNFSKESVDNYQDVIVDQASAEIIEPITDKSEAPETRGSRITTIVEKEYNNNFNEAIKTGNQFGEDSLLVGSANGYDIDCFLTSSFSTWPGAGVVFNITIQPSSFSGFTSSEDWIVVQLWQWWNFNGDDYVDEVESILLHQESYNPYYSSSPCWGYTSEMSMYFVRVIGSPKTEETILNYELNVDWEETDVNSNDTSYKIDTAIPVTSNSPQQNKMIDMDYMPIDWYSINPIFMTGWEGVNVSIKLKIEDSSLKSIYSDGLPDGALFVMELRAVILHELKNGKIVFGGMGNSSLHDSTINYPGLKKQVDHYSLRFFSSGSKEVVKSYIGIYIVTYGLDRNSRHIRYHDGDRDNRFEDDAINGWLKYSFVKVNSEPIVKPVLTPVSVYSIRTNTKYGRTPDMFKYHIWYQSRANYQPIVFKLHILKHGKLIRVEEIVPVNEGEQNYRTPSEFQFKIEGEKLQQGCFQFQVECWDKHIYAIGSKDHNKEPFDGPCIINNIPPQVRDTAITYIEMEEDDKPIYLKLKDFFVDADDDELSNYLLDANGNLTTIWQTYSLNLRIKRDGTLKIEPRPNRYGKSKINLITTDNVEPLTNATHQIIVTVAPINDPPQIKTSFDNLFFFGEIRFDEDTSYSDLNLNDVFMDHPMENEPLTFTVSGNEHLNVEISPNGSVNIIPYENWSGVEEIRFTATDPPGGAAYDDLKVRIQPVNDAPILNDTPPIIAYEDSWTNISFNAWDPADDDPLSFSTDVAIKVSLNENEYIFDSNTGKLSLFPPNRVATGGVYKVHVTVRDKPREDAGKPISVTKNVNITIRNTWDKPSCRIIEPRNEDKFLHFEPIIFQGLVEDDDQKVPQVNEKITYEWFSDIDGKLGNNEVIRNVPLTAGSSGQKHKITFRVSDGKFFSQAEIYVWVLHPDDKKDTDGDGMPDYWEERNNLDKYNSADADYDGDTDGFTNYEEFYYGRDGLPDNNDPTDPWDLEDFPQGIKEGPVDEEVDYLWPLMILFIIAIVMIISIIITYMMISSKVRTARDYAERKRELEEELKKQRQKEQDDQIYGIYAPKKADALCHSCGHRNKIVSGNRPLAITCSQCNTRGVIY